MIMNYVKEQDILKAVANPYAFAGSDAFPYTDESGQIWPWDSSNDVWGDTGDADTRAPILLMARERDELTLMQFVAKLSNFQTEIIDEMVPYTAYPKTHVRGPYDFRS